MKILFVLTDSTYMYGASKSLKSLLDSLDDSFEYDIIVGKSITNNTKEEIVRKNFGDKMGKIYYIWVPRYRCYSYTKLGIVSEISHWLNNIMAFFSRRKVFKLIDSCNYDYIHLNSMVLFPMIEKNHCYIIHNREIVKKGYILKSLLKNKLSKSKGIISIDSSTEKALMSLLEKRENYITLSNPINMSGIMDYDPQNCAKLYDIMGSHEQIIFALIGQISEEKGTRFILECFTKANIKNAILIIAGNTKNDYAKEVIQDYSQSSNVSFVGEIKEINMLYRIADCVIRGEAEFAVGRTQLEALFAGINVLVPGSVDDMDSIVNSYEYMDRIYFYEPRNTDDFIEKLYQIKSIDWDKRKGDTNVLAYGKKYMDYVRSII